MLLSLLDRLAKPLNLLAWLSNLWHSKICMKKQIALRLVAFFIIANLLSLFLNSAEARKRYRKVPLNEQLTEELNGVLKAANDLHGAAFEQDEEKIESSLQKVAFSLERADRKSVLAESQKTHLKKMIEAAKSGVQLTKNTAGNKRVDHLKDTFKQIVQIAQTYDLDKYKIFFCPEDRAVWLQSSWKAKNPIHPKIHKKCGKLVR
jgi:hypothetical protein